MSWHALAWWEVRTRMSPELLAGGLSVVVVVVAGIFWLGPFAATAPADGGRGGGSTATPAASTTPVPTLALDTKSVQPVLVLNQRLLETAAEADAALRAEPFSTADAAAILRRINATVTSARELVGSLERDARTAALGTELATLYLELKDLADGALGSSLSNAAAYQSALAELPTWMSRLADVDEELESLLD